MRPLVLPEKGPVRHHFGIHHETCKRPKFCWKPQYRFDSNHERAANRHKNSQSLNQYSSFFQARRRDTPRAFLFSRKKTGIHSAFSHSPATSNLYLLTMSVNIEMPKLSDTMTEGTLVKWHKNVGDSVEIGDILEKKRRLVPHLPFSMVTPAQYPIKHIW
jgi:hypothetical protein